MAEAQFLWKWLIYSDSLQWAGSESIALDLWYRAMGENSSASRNEFGLPVHSGI